MSVDFEVFDPTDENIAQIIVRILEEKGYCASYQLGYPRNKIFIKLGKKGEANKISGIIREFMKAAGFSAGEISASEVDSLASKLGSLIPDPPNQKLEQPTFNVEKKPDTDNDIFHPEVSEREVHENAKIEEFRGKIDERLNELNKQISNNPKDRSNEKRRIERDTLVWVLQNIP
jgi:hypothetical protein